MSWLKQLFWRGSLFNDLSGEMHRLLEEKIDDLVLRALPFEEPQRLVHVWTTDVVALRYE